MFHYYKVNKGAKIRTRYNQVPHLTADTYGKVTNSQLSTTNESQEASPFPAGDHKAHINRRAQRHNKHKTEKNINDPQKKYRLGTVSKIFHWRAETCFKAPTSPSIQMSTKTHRYLVCMKDPNLSMHHLLEHINQDIKRRYSKDKVSTHYSINNIVKMLNVTSRSLRSCVHLMAMLAPMRPNIENCFSPISSDWLE